MELAPGDKRTIREFIEGVRDFTRMELPVDLTAEDMKELAEMGKDMLPVLLPTLRWQGVTLSEYADRFKDPLLREGLRLFFQFAPTDFPMMLCLSTLAMMNDHEAGYPLGGSLPISKALAAGTKLGGKIVIVQVNKVLWRRTGLWGWYWKMVTGHG